MHAGVAVREERESNISNDFSQFLIGFRMALAEKDVFLNCQHRPVIHSMKYIRIWFDLVEIFESAKNSAVSLTLLS